MARAGWLVAMLAGIAVLLVVRDAGDAGVPERWAVPLQGPGGGAVVARATCYEAPRRVVLDLTRAGGALLATEGSWLAEKAAVHELTCNAGWAPWAAVMERPTDEPKASRAR